MAVQRPGAGAILRALAAKTQPYPDADPLLVALARQLADDVDAADSVSQRVAAVRMLLEVADRLDLVPLSPGRGQARAPDGPVAAAGGEDGPVDGDPFGLPDVPAGVGDPP